MSNRGTSDVDAVEPHLIASIYIYVLSASATCNDVYICCMQSENLRSLQTAWSPCRLNTPQKLAILFDNGYYSFSCLYLGETMTSLFARNERLL